jgi:hypothetical protein
MVSRLARPLLVTGIAVAPARQALKGSGSSGDEPQRRQGSVNEHGLPSKPGDQEHSQQGTEHCTNVVPGREGCGGATAPALARTTISAPLLTDRRRVALSRPRKTSSPRRRPRAAEMDELRQPRRRAPGQRFARGAALRRTAESKVKSQDVV